MPSTYSSLKIQLMATGENATTWGTVTNTNLGTAIEEAIVGSANVTFASANVTLTLSDSNSSQTARNMRLNLVGTTGGATRNLVVPSIEKPYVVKNDCADSVVVKTAAGSGVTVPAGKTLWVYSDGTNVVDVVSHLTDLTLATALPVASGGTGSNTASGARTNLGLGSMATQNSNSVTITGGAISGITDLAVADGGTGASTAADARTNLGLGSLAVLSSINNSNWSGTVLTVANGGTGASDAGTARTNLGLGSLATASTINNANWSGTVLAVTNGGTGASDAGTARTNLGLGNIATQNTNSVTITGGSISGIVPLALADGGTGSNTAAGARNNLGLGSLATLSAINNANWSGTVLSVANGGTGSSIAATARTNLGIGTIGTQDSNNVNITGGTIGGITDLAIADGGTGASDAGTARTNLGLGSLATASSINNSNWSGTALAVSNGGTGATSNTAARVNLLPSYTGNAGKILALNSTASDTEWVSAGGVGSVTSVNATTTLSGLSFSGGPITSAGTLTLSGTLGVANGGTGTTSLTSGAVLIGAGTSAVSAVAPGTSGNVLVSNGSAWVSSAPSASGVTSFNTRTGAVTLTGTDVVTGLGYTPPATNGTGATGTWGINISGNAATVTNGVYTNGSYANPAWITSLAGSKISGDISGNAATATTATTATTANALNTSNNYQVNSLGVGTAGSGTAGEIRATNNVTAYYSSDARLKENVKPIQGALDAVTSIGGKTFDWTDKYIEEHGGEDGYFVRKSDFGVIAQDVEAVFPLAVRTREDGTMAVDYEKLCALAFQAIAELRTEVEALKNGAA